MDLKDLLLSSILSLELARQHYPDTALHTDSRGADLLVDRLGLRFASVHTDLDALDDRLACWWSLGKLLAYRAQETPFVHVDNDVYLWRRLPRRLEDAPVFGQNPERFTAGESNWYLTTEFAELAAASGAVLPCELPFYEETSGASRYAICCGIFGGRNLAIIGHYADTALNIAAALASRVSTVARWQLDRHMVLIEQYFLAACVEYHRHTECFGRVEIEYLFIDAADASQRGAAAGYTHLIGGAKRNPELRSRLEERVRRDYPTYYRRVLEVLAGSTWAW